MKNLLMIALAIVTINVSAQERKKDGYKGEMKERMEMTPQERASIQTKKMTLHLDLTASQQAEVEKILLEEATTRNAKMAERKANMDKSDAVKPSKEERLEMVNARLDHQIEMKKKMKSILNAEQYEKFETMQSKKQNMRGEKSHQGKYKK